MRKVTIGITLSDNEDNIEITRKSAALAPVASLLAGKGILPEEMDFTVDNVITYTCMTDWSEHETRGMMRSIPSIYWDDSFVTFKS